MFLTIGRTFKEAFKNFFRNGWLTLATISVLILSLYAVSMTYAVSLTVDNILKGVESNVNISVYFKPDVSEDQIFEARSELEKNSAVKSVEYVSRDQALENFKRDNEDEPIIMQSLEELGDNPLLNSLVVRAGNPDDYQGIADYINQSSFKNKISRLNYDRNKDIISKLNIIIDTIRRVGIGLGVILGLISALIIFNTIRITIYAQRREIEVMRLVGASNTFIRLPFIFEGIIYGLIASVVAMPLVFLTIKYLTPQLVPGGGGADLIDIYKGLFMDMDKVFFSHFVKIFIIQIVSSAVLGIASSAIAMRKYLKI